MVTKPRKQADPRKAIVEVMARLGRETQLHMDERSEHFRLTDKVIRRVSLILLITAIINIYLVWVLSRNLDGIVGNMDSMQHKLIEVDRDMSEISRTVEKFDTHITYVHIIASNIGDMTTNLPLIRLSMDNLVNNMASINVDMQGMKSSINNINYNMMHMTSGMSGMQYNVRQFSKPMGVMNPVFP
jgi:uncharacterized protein YoxC